MSRYVFPRWSNLLLPTILVVGLLAPLYVALMVAYGFSPETTDVGYMPTQPVPFSHAMHAGTLGMDCRYCHNTVERSAYAAIPPTQTCMNCHTQIHATSPQLAVVRESFETGMPIPWVKVHDLPDFSYFDHAAHVNRGVGCVSCHGRVDQMEVVRQYAPLSMGWCLECHRNPEPNLRPTDTMTIMSFDQRRELSRDERLSLRDLFHINPSENCSTCHR